MRQHYRLLLVFFASLTFNACYKEPETANQPWIKLAIQLDGQMIFITRINESAYTRILVPKDTIQYFSLSQLERDSIYKMVHHLIQYPVTPKSYVNAASANDVTFVIDCKQYSNRIDYRYLKSWKNLSPETESIHRLLSRKIKFVTL